MAIELTDDGTLDTVLRCDLCGEEFRFSFQNDGADAQTYDEFVECCIDDATSEHDCPETREPEPDFECDITTEDHREFFMEGRKVLHYEHKLADCYIKRGVSVFLGRFETVEEALRACMERLQYYPNVWFIGDHGNAHLMEV